MFSWLTDPNILLGGVILAILQLLAALPWLRAIDSRSFDRSLKDPQSLGYAILMTIGVAIAIAAFLGYKGDSEYIQLYGRFYGAILHLQLLVDLFILGPAALAVVWPKGGAVALATYRESLRQPMFWLIGGFAALLIWLFVVIPYFTFGDDYKMMKQIGFDVVMMAAVLFGVLAASISISEEIEGRTAITVMSKPINRRQFLIGKFFGILMACGVMTLLLGLDLNGALLVMPEFDPLNKDRSVDPMAMQAKNHIVPLFTALVPSGPATPFFTGTGMWFGEVFAHFFGMLLGYGQVMILVAIAASLATRMSFIINLVICLLVYLLGHLAPVVVRVTDHASDQNETAIGLIRFLGNTFDTILPALEFYSMGPAIIRETSLSLWPFIGYVATVFGYSIIYTVIVLIVGLLLFEDRDLA